MIRPRVPAATASQFASTDAGLGAFRRARRLPPPHPPAALAKLHGRRLKRRWPFLAPPRADSLKLNSDAVPKFQHARGVAVDEMARRI